MKIMQINKLLTPIIFTLVLCVGGIGTSELPSVTTARQGIDDGGYRTQYVPDYDSVRGEIEPDDVQCPIPMDNRVRNHTGTQCVFSSIEMLGRWAEEPKLINPPITSDSKCRSYSGPSHAASQLTRLGVKFEQSYQKRSEGIALIKKAMKEKRGCLWGVPGHAMVLIHYSEEEDRVCWVDNSDRTLKVQTTTVASFKRRWDSWVLVIYPDDESALQEKLGYLLPWLKIPILDSINPNHMFPDGYIPKP